MESADIINESALSAKDADLRHTHKLEAYLKELWKDFRVCRASGGLRSKPWCANFNLKLGCFIIYKLGCFMAFKLSQLHFRSFIDEHFKIHRSHSEVKYSHSWRGWPKSTIKIHVFSPLMDNNCRHKYHCRPSKEYYVELERFLWTETLELSCLLTRRRKEISYLPQTSTKIIRMCSDENFPHTFTATIDP